MDAHILAFDTAMAACSVCVSRGHRVLARRLVPMQRGQAEALVPMIDAVLAEAGLGIEAVTVLATTVGPGAFTGVRIGLATAHGLALARGLPVLGVTTLEAIAAEHGDRRPLLAVLETKRSDFYVQLFGADGPLADGPAARDGPEIFEDLPDGSCFVAGDGADRWLAACAAATARVRRLEGADTADAAAVARICATRLADGLDPAGLPPLKPLYLRPPDVRRPAS